MLKKLTLAEGFAFFRIVTSPIMVALVFLLDKQVFAWVYIICFGTDALDGFSAFVMKNDSDRREILDTWGDNLYILAGMVGFFFYEKDFFMSYIELTCLVVGLYIVELILSLSRFGKPSYFHNYLAKAAFFFQLVFLADIFFFDANLFLFLLAVTFSVLDVIDEVIILFNIKKWQTHIKGFWKVI